MRFKLLAVSYSVMADLQPTPLTFTPHIKVMLTVTRTISTSEGSVSMYYIYDK
jgi:hypothetical protein